MRPRRLLPPLLLLGLVAVGILVAPRLPDPVPIHWNLAGEPDAWGGPWLAALGLPVIGLAVWGFIAAMTGVAVERGQAPVVRRALDRLQLLMALVWTALYASTLAPRLGLPVPLDPTGAGLLVLGLFLVGTGTVLRRTGSGAGGEALVNLPVDDPQLKRDVLRVSTRALVVGGGLLVPAAFFGPGVRLVLVLAGLGLPAVGLPLYVVVRLVRRAA